MKELLITQKWLEDNDINDFLWEGSISEKYKELLNLPIQKFINKLINLKNIDIEEEYLNKLKDLDTADTIIGYALDRKHCVEYAIYAAEKVLPKFEYEYNNSIAKQILSEGKSWLKNPNMKFTKFNYRKFFDGTDSKDEYTIYPFMTIIAIATKKNYKAKFEGWSYRIADIAINLIGSYPYDKKLTMLDVLNNTRDIISFGLKLYKNQIKENELIKNQENTISK